MKARRWFVLLLMLGGSLTASGQYNKEFKRIFFDAQQLYEAGFYEESYNRFSNLLALDPGNSNILFHCGTLCLYIQGKEAEAIPYLEEAVKGVSPDYKPNNHKETSAPVFTYYILGRAYHLNGQYDLAMDYYQTYLAQGEGEDPTQLEYAALQLEAAAKARDQMGMNPSYKFQNLMDFFDDKTHSCSNPVISGDGNLFIYLVDYPSDKKIMMSTRGTDGWSRPRNINKELGMVGETYPVSLSYDGKELYLAHYFYSHSDIYVSTYEGGSWSEAEPLGPNINGRTSETHASISRDGNTLYFTSNKRGGQGSYDIYVSKRNGKGTWGPATNLGPVINTPYEERTPFISSDEATLFFSSQGHGSIGGLDIFFTEYDPDSGWTRPVNIGIPVNTTGDDQFFNPGWNELDGYYAVRREDNPSISTINTVIELEPEEIASLTEEIDSTKEEVSQPLEETVVMNEPEEQREQEITVVAVPDEEEVPAPVEEEVPAPATEVIPELYTIIPFSYNSHQMTLSAQFEAEKIADLMGKYEETRLELTGHADATGSAEYNLLLSLHRADRIARYLAERGVDPERISVEGMGEATPLARNRNPNGTDSPLGRWVNRHVIARVTGSIPASEGLSWIYIPESLKPVPSLTDNEKSKRYTLTIQVMADLKPVQQQKLKNLDQVDEYVCNDGYYRYTSGSYRDYTEAKKALTEIQKRGYPDAFIKTAEWYQMASE
jgi:outer membrane protein OmpA-like peptidoglycan-associated protein/tetratricopeptide (TPR) repeat protein